MMVWSRFIVALALAVIIRAREIQPGTVIPVMLSSSINAAKDQAGKKIEGRVMQKVPLTSGGAISERSRIFGHIVKVTKQGPSGSSVVLAFDSIQDHGRTIAITTGLL